LAGFITAMFGFKFSVHTGKADMVGALQVSITTVSASLIRLPRKAALLKAALWRCELAHDRYFRAGQYGAA
jgi:hypothetical protein